MPSNYFLVVTCDSLSLSHGDVDYDNDAVDGGYPVDTTASFSCDSKYDKKGSSSITCQTSGSWSDDTPHCKKSKE